MHTIHKQIALLGLMILSLTSTAHQPDISTTLLIEHENNSWVLQVNASLTAFQYQVKGACGDSAYQSPEEFKSLLIQNMKENLVAIFNEDQSLVFEQAHVKLGHETSVVFEVSGIPEHLETVHFQNTAFKNIHGNQGALVIMKSGFTKEHFIMNKANAHTLRLEVADQQFVLSQTHHTASKRVYFYLALATLLLLLSAVYIWANPKKEKMMAVTG